VGELNPDLILDGLSGLPRLGQEILASRCVFPLGSSTALCAANLAALGLRVGFVGKVGHDLFGDFVLRSLCEWRIDASRVIRDPAVRTGVTVSLAYPQDRAMVTFLRAMTCLRAEDVDYVSRAPHLHVSSAFLQQALQPGCADLFRAAKERGLTISLDPGWDPNEEKEWRRAAGHLAGRVSTVVVKRGREGASAIQSGTWFEHPGFAVEAVDPTGAGDAFNAGFLLGRLSGWPARACLAWGNACGAMAAAHPGGSGAFTDHAAVEEFIRSREESRECVKKSSLGRERHRNRLILRG
jgi:sugar/nucleoside kinase (ribokinase family)